MKTLRLIQVGDVHFPEARGKTLLDLKDDAFPKGISAKIAIRPLQSVIREISLECKNTKIDGILLCGDLTSKGNLEGYKECVEYFVSVLAIDDPSKWPLDHVHIVPGNHDVCRGLCNPPDGNLLKKFDPLRSAWKDASLDQSFTCDFRQTQVVSVDGCRVAVFSLNSCVGCGEVRLLPEKIRNELAEILEAYEKKHGLDKAFDLIGEDLDTPAFTEDNISRVYEEVNSLDSGIIPVVLAHHNILPQVLPRIAMYTELLNAGFARSRLARIRQPVITATVTSTMLW